MKVGLIYINVNADYTHDKILAHVLNRLDAKAVEVDFVNYASSVQSVTGVGYENVNYVLVVGSDDDLAAIEGTDWYNKERTIAWNVASGYAELDTLITKIVKSRAVFHHRYIKSFGLSQEEISEKISNIPMRKSEVILRPSLLECDVIIRYSDKLNRDELEMVTDAIVKRLAGCVYAVGDEDTSLVRTAHTLLQAKGKRLAVAESFTGGNIAASIVEYSGASKILLEGIVAYSNISKMHRLDVDAAILSKEGAVSNETAYQMAANLLNTSGADMVISTTGFADPADEQAGLCFIAIGDKRGIHLYKCVFRGDRQQVIESGVKTAFFKLISELNRL